MEKSGYASALVSFRDNKHKFEEKKVQSICGHLLWDRSPYVRTDNWNLLPVHLATCAIN